MVMEIVSNLEKLLGEKQPKRSLQNTDVAFLRKNTGFCVIPHY